MVVCVTHSRGTYDTLGGEVSLQQQAQFVLKDSPFYIYIL